MPAPTLTIETAWMLQPDGRPSEIVALIGPRGPAGPSTAEAAQSALEAAASAVEADASATAAAASAATATTKAAEALASAGIASAAATTATTKAGEASGSAVTATAAAATATTKASEASTSATNAGNAAATATAKADEASGSAATATAAEATATTKAGEASASAATATTKAGEASDSADSASASEATATTKAAEATTKATEASDSAATATAKAGEAAGSAASALAIYGSVGAQEAAVTTAQAQASLAAGYAASAGSVVQQDLSGVTAQALHRSPNAITALCIYDTSKDSDGGAWTERCQHTSWWNEALNGKWLGPQASEAAARAVAGAATGDYFQLTTDGKFYKLNAGAGTTEVYRGNKRDFPRLAGIVAEAGGLTIYDLTEPGRPMWMRFAASPTSSYTAGTFLILNSANLSLCSLAAMNGILCIADNQTFDGGLRTVNFARDYLASQQATQNYTGVFNGGVAKRNATLGYALGQLTTLVNKVVNAVAMTVLPDAPVDPATGLRVPTIAVGTNAGLNVIRHDGVVTNPSAFATVNVSFDARGAVVFQIGENGRNYRKSAWPFTTSITHIGGPLAFGGSVSTINGMACNRHTGGKLTIARGIINNTAVLIRDNDRATGAALGAVVSPLFNTGWMIGDIRRCLLSDTVTGALTATEFVTNGDNEAALMSTPWRTPVGALNGTVVRSTEQASSGSASAKFASNTGAATTHYIAFGPIPAGQSVIITGKAFLPTGSLTQLCVIDVNDGSLIQPIVTSTKDAWVDFTVICPAKALSWDLVIGNNATEALPGATFYLDNVSIKEAVGNRMWRGSGAAINGSLTRAQLASGTSLVAFSGWSAANYLREPYSTDLNFGTSEWTVSAWASIPAVVSAVGVIAERSAATGPSIRLAIDATGKLVATAYDGTTTRTVTTTASYNTAQWLKARASYTTDGTLAISVNGREVATARGAPLLTLFNPDATLTIGNSFALDAPFPGSIALLKIGATVPTPEQAVFMYEQEKHLFRDGAISVLPDTGAIFDMAYDEATDRWVVVSQANASYWSGLVCASAQAVPAGTFTKIAAGAGVELAARSTTSPGVDVTIPAYGLREELVRRAEAAARLSKELASFDFVGGFTANTTTDSTAITSVAGLTYPTSLIGARVSGAGIPANTTIIGVSGTTIYLSAKATATATGVSVSFLDFGLPVGMEAKTVICAGALKQEGSTKDFTRLFDGFREAIRFAVAPGSTAWVQIQATRGTVQ